MIVGLLSGAVLSVVVLSAVSLMLPLPPRMAPQPAAPRPVANVAGSPETGTAPKLPAGDSGAAPEVAATPAPKAAPAEAGAPAAGQTTPPPAATTEAAQAPAAPAAEPAPTASAGSAPSGPTAPAAPAVQPADTGVAAGQGAAQPQVSSAAALAPAAPAPESAPAAPGSQIADAVPAAPPYAPAAPAGHAGVPTAPVNPTVQPGMVGTAPGVQGQAQPEGVPAAVPSTSGVPAETPLPVVAGQARQDRPAVVEGRAPVPQPAVPAAPSAASSGAGGAVASVVVPKAPGSGPVILNQPGAPAAPGQAGDAPPAGQTAATPAARPAVTILKPSQPQAGFHSVPGVKVNRLPQVGSASGEAKLPGVKVGSLPGKAATPGGSGAARAAPAAEATQPPIVRNAVPAQNPDAKPELAVILIDDGATTLDRSALAASPLPVSFAIDPTAAQAGDWATTYYGGGHEVLLKATAIPRLATPSDLNVTFSAYFRAAPEAVGVIDLAHGGFQDNRLMAQRVVAILAGDGYGLVTYRRGLNAAAQVAATTGIEAAQITGATVRTDRGGLQRLLDRAAFRAAQEGKVVVAVPASSAVLATIDAWSKGMRGRSVALVPVTAVMGK